MSSDRAENFSLSNWINDVTEASQRMFEEIFPP